MITPSQDDIFDKFWSVFRSHQFYSGMLNNQDRSVRNTRFISWTQPPMGWIKLNGDGSVLSNRRASCGGVMRDDSGQFLQGFAVNLGICPITVAEIWGAFYALDMARTGKLFWNWTLLRHLLLLGRGWTESTHML